jgi:hypothetical protein
MEANKKFGAAATEWNKLLKQLQTRVHEPDMKSRYFECYFHLVRSLYLHGIASKESKYIKQAAGLMIKLENAWPDFGGEASETRFREFLAQEKELSEQYNQQKNQQKAAK